MTKGVTFYFIRHGETYFNFYNRMQGWSNAPLTKKGIHDLQRSGRGLADIHFDAVYSSDLQRTMDTAEIIIDENKYADEYTIEPMKEFREVCFGSFEGLPAKDAWTQVTDDIRLKHDLPEGSIIEIKDMLDQFKALDPYHHAENYREFWFRVEEGLLKLLNRHAGTDQNILVVSHGMTIRNLLHGLVAEFDYEEPIANGAVSIVKYQNGKFDLLAYNQTDHFADIAEEAAD